VRQVLSFQDDKDFVVVYKYGLSRDMLDGNCGEDATDSTKVFPNRDNQRNERQSSFLENSVAQFSNWTHAQSS